MIHPIGYHLKCLPRKEAGILARGAPKRRLHNAVQQEFG
jgi:hypothetical protein